jgi:uncharacterized protein YcbK (DUF882 family)
MNEKLLILLDKIREAVGVPVQVLSGYRCPEHNKECGGVKDSQHMQRTAADIRAKGYTVEELAKVAEGAGADGVGRYVKQNFVHVDVRGFRARWNG